MDTSEVPRGGVRLRWDQLPDSLRAEVESRLGAPVVSAVGQSGGFSPGAAARLVLADGSRAFVKAVSDAQNPLSPAIYRREAEAAASLPSQVPAPRLKFWLDDGSWVLLAYEDVEGSNPALPWRVDELDLVLDTLCAMAASLTPAPGSAPSLAAELGEDFSGWRRLVGAPPPDLDSWSARHLERLADLESGWVSGSVGDTLLHVDLRADNLIVTPERRVVVVDWSGPCTGAAWVDLVTFLVNPALFGGFDPQALLLSRPLGRRAPADAVDALLCALAGYFAAGSRKPAPAGLPTLRAFQRAQERVVLDWLRRRTGWA